MTRILVAVFAYLLVSSNAPGAQSAAHTSIMSEAWQAVQAGDADRAAVLFRQELERRPRDPILHFGAGVAAHMMGREQDAIESLRQALKLDPGLIDAARVLGEIEYYEGNIDDAIRTYENALAHAPTDSALRKSVEAWRKEAALNQTLTQRNDGRFSVVFEGRTDKALAERAIATLDAAFWRIGKAIGGFPSRRIELTLYTEQQFRDITRAPEWSDGIFDGRIRIPVKGAVRNLQEFDRVLTHELTHAMVSGLAARGVPDWLHEGLASYFEPQDPARAVQVLKTTGLLPFSKFLDGFQQLNSREATIAYLESLVLADVLMRRVGNRMSILLQHLDRGGQSVADSLKVVGVSLTDLEADLIRRFK
jgi:tetratricopeptide (TPR) repeat protein